MTVYTQETSKKYPADGVTTDYGFPIPFIEANDLIVSLILTATGVPITPAPVMGGGATYDYILIVAEPPPHISYPTGATVRFNTAPLATYTVLLKRVTDDVQPVALIDDAKLPATTVNLEFDRLTMISQEQESDIAYILGIIPLLNPAAGGLIMKWRAAWLPNTPYLLGDVVTNTNNLYVCITAHTSAAAFDASKWTLVIDLNTAVQAAADAQNAAIIAQAAAATIPLPGGAGNAGLVPAVNSLGTAYALVQTLQLLV